MLLLAIKKPAVGYEEGDTMLYKTAYVAVGYEEGDTMLYKTGCVADFIISDEHLQLLSSVNKLVFDEQQCEATECSIRVFIVQWE